MKELVSFNLETIQFRTKIKLDHWQTFPELPFVNLFTLFARFIRKTQELYRKSKLLLELFNFIYKSSYISQFSCRLSERK